MKTSSILTALLLLFSVCVSAQKYPVTPRAMVNGKIIIGDQQYVNAGDSVMVTCEPDPGYGLSADVLYYAKKENGEYSDPKKAENKSSFPEDRASKQHYWFKMPAAPVEVWASFVPLRTLVIHQQTGGKLVPLYGFKKSSTENMLWNVPGRALKIKVTDVDKANDYKLLDVQITNVDQTHYQKSDTMITVWMPNDEDTVHVTPVFGKSHYAVDIKEELDHIKATVSDMSPKSREEVDVTFKTEKGYIPANVSITGCSNSWRVGKPKRLDNGGWEVVYRFKVELQDVSVTYGIEPVLSINIKDTNKSGRVKTYIPEMIPDYPNVVRSGQQIPVVFMMPDSFSVKHTVTGDVESKEVYHNVLQNSFADEGMGSWTESYEYASWGLPMRAFTDSVGNKYWHASVKNIMSQSVAITNQSKTDDDVKAGKLSIAAIASINPCSAQQAQASIVATGKDISESKWVVANLSNQPEGWQTVLKTGTVDIKADTLKFLVESKGEHENKSRSYEGPMFDDLCLLLPTASETIKNEDVLILKMREQDVTIDYTASGTQNKMSVKNYEHGKVTLFNTNTYEEGETVQALQEDVIVVKAQADEGYAVYQMKYGNISLSPDSINMAANMFYYHFTKLDDTDETVAPTIAQLQVFVDSNYGGELTVSNQFAKKGDKVTFTVTPNDGCKVRRIKTFPAGLVTLTEENVDANTRGGTYSFIMPAAHFTLSPEYIVPITTKEQLGDINGSNGEFILANDLTLGDAWSKTYDLAGDFDGNGHSITYGGKRSLFNSVTGSVRHLYVNANLKGVKDATGGICKINTGTIEDCEISGTIANTTKNACAGGVAGKNGPQGGIISHCHVVATIDGPKAYGIAYQQEKATIRDNVFNGQFDIHCNRMYMICNDEKSSTIDGNYYIENIRNAKAERCSGVTLADPARLVQDAKDMAGTYPVYAASIKKRYNDVFTVTLSLPAEVYRVNLSQETAVPGAVITGSVRVEGNQHLVGITVSDTLGNNAQNCPFTDHMNNVYSFSFSMPAHDAKVTFQTESGRYIYTAQQFVDVNNQEGTFYLVRDIELNNWVQQIDLFGNFYGGGHTIKYSSSTSCVGLFNKICKGALLQGLRVIGNVQTEVDCGGIAKENQGTIRDCHFSGRISIMATPGKKKKTLKEERIAALVCDLTTEGAVVDHCSATGELKSSRNQEVIDSHPLCYVGSENVKNTVWVSPKATGQYSQQVALAEAARKDYPVFANGILDKINPRVIVGRDTIRVQRGTTLDKLTLIDGEPFICTGDVSVKQIVYKRSVMSNTEQWVLPFAFDGIAGSGPFEYSKLERVNDMPKVGATQRLTLTDKSTSVTYNANEPWMVKGDGGEYVLTHSSGSITVHATDNTHMDMYASVTDEGHIYATYNVIPGNTAKGDLLYVWDSANQKYILSGESGNPADIQPYRFYVQFYNKINKVHEKYTQTEWYKKDPSSSSSNVKAAHRSLASAMADGWQPIFLDPRQPQSVTTRMLDYYEVAYLTDISAEVIDENADAPLAAVSLIYRMADHSMELPPALPLLVRAKRSDAQPLVDEKTGAEIEDMDDDIPHYWCASYGNRLDIWALPSSENYADLAEYNAMMFEDTYFDQSFNYAINADSRTTGPMSYCITVLNEDTYEPLPLMGDRVSVQFISSGSATGINTVKGEGVMVHDSKSYNLSGQRVGAGYKGIIIQNGRKVMKR